MSFATAIVPPAALLAAVLPCTTAPGQHGTAAERSGLRGEWLVYRHNRSLDGHTPATGRITEPKIAWRHYVGRVQTTLVVEPAQGRSTLMIPPSEPGAAPAGRSWDDRWCAERLTGLIAGRQQRVPVTGTVTYADVLPEVPGLEKIEFASSFNIPTVNGQWQDGPGRCFAWNGGRWQQVWQSENVHLNFLPYPIAGDFDADGRLEIALLPWYELLIFDARTGKPKHRCRFTKGRSYGFFGVYDFDGDGKKEFLVMADFAKHVDVLGYRQGKLSLLWQYDIEPDIADPQKILRLIPEPAADLDGDGVFEVVLNLFNDTGDDKWHLVVRDGITGKVEADLADEIAQGVADLDGDRTYELLTAKTEGRGLPPLGTIRVRSLRDGRITTRWQGSHMAWQTCEAPLNPHTQNGATRGRVGVLTRTADNHRTFAILRQPVLAQRDAIRLSVARWDDNGFRFGTTITGPDLKGLGLDASGAMLVRGITRPDRKVALTVEQGEAEPVYSSPTGVMSPGPPVVARAEGEDRPTIIAQGYGTELVALRAPALGRPAVQRWRLVGRGQSTRWPSTLGPVVADLMGDGSRQVIYAATAPAGCARLVVADLAGKQLWWHDFPRITGELPVWNVGGIILWQAGHFTDHRRQDIPRRQDILVTVRRSMMHSDETFLLSGRDGRRLWHRRRQISRRGCGGQPFAVADFNADGLDDAASLYPSILYILDGPTGRDILAKDCTWPGVPLKPAYWGQPVAGWFDGSGTPGLLFTTGGRSMVGLIRGDGSLAWSDAYDKAGHGFPAVGDFDGDGKLEAFTIGFADGSRCYDTATGKLRWSMPLGANQNPRSAVCGDIDGDGRDEAVFVLGRTLYCVGTRPDGQSGAVLWTLELPTEVSTPVLAKVDGTGADDRLSILLAGADGYVYCINQE